jgi:hypothetical protein
VADHVDAILQVACTEAYQHLKNAGLAFPVRLGLAKSHEKKSVQLIPSHWQIGKLFDLSYLLSPQFQAKARLFAVASASSEPDPEAGIFLPTGFSSPSSTIIPRQ